jgi:hypothetical protein
VVNVEPSREGLELAAIDAVDLPDDPVAPSRSEATARSDAGRYRVCRTYHDHWLSFRTAPGRPGQEILRIPEGDAVEPTGEKRGRWWKVTYRQQTGWAHSDYLCPALAPSTSE